MKSLVELLNEALGDVTPKQFMDIWKGKNVSIDTETMNNVAYFSNELCNVHRSKLPTSEEFANVCKYIADNASWSTDNAETFLIRIMETYLQTKSIYDYTETIKLKEGDFKFIKTGKSMNFFEDDLRVNLAALLFFRMHLADTNLKNANTLNVAKKLCKDMFEPAFKKFGVFWDNWPDYSEGFNMLLNKFK